MLYGLDVSITAEYADPRLLANLALEAELSGWDGFFTWDILLGQKDEPVVDPWIALSAIAVNTQRIRIGALVTPLPRRHPWKVARGSVSLGVLSGGRLTFGAGLGWDPRECLAFDNDDDLIERGETI
ncbi:MAG: LLM class flavin-dependent oxidoreductase [Candidatus Thorarchaeota archaeon]|jgi:alkanesulfonate monooxygenase SsuD/methylene tetrahydromethanopterin reductase-like flavin-dependent oxidoreductase (luciferase family)